MQNLNIIKFINKLYRGNSVECDYNVNNCEA